MITNCTHAPMAVSISDGGRSGRLAGLVRNGEGSYHSPTARRAARRRPIETIASDPTLAWRIRFRRVTIIPVMRPFLMVRLWTSFRSAVHEFKMSRMIRKSDSRFRVVEVRKHACRRFSSSGCGPDLSTSCNQLKRAVSRTGEVAAALVACPKSPTNANASFELISGAEEEEDEEEEEESNVGATFSTPINRTRWKEIEIGEFSPPVNQLEIPALSSSKSMKEFGSLKWEGNFLTTSASTRSVLDIGESSTASTSCFDQCRWANRVSNHSPQLVQPVRGKLTVLSSLLRTMSDRYARRTGKLTPLHDKGNNERPLLKQSLSAAPCVMEPKHQRTNSTSAIIADVPVRRYDNPFQDFLRRSFAERNSTLAQEGERER